MLHIVNIIPASLSDESGQDSEPNLAVNPAQPSDMVATAFTPAPMGGPNAPIYVSTDGGNTWSLRMVVPGNGFAGTGDITVGFATTGGTLYAGILNGTTGRMQILRTSNFASTTTMAVLVDRDSEDQPWVVAASVVVGPISQDRVFVGNNKLNQPGGKTPIIDVSQNAATAAPPAGFTPVQLEHRSTARQDGPPIRTALHPDGTVYAAFQRVVTNRFIRFNAMMGQERLGADLSIAVDPTDANTAWIAWCDRVGGSAGTDWTLHVSRSVDRGQTWSADLRTITNAKNPALAVNSNRLLGLLYQQFTGTTWDTKLELTPNGWSSPVAPLVLHTARSNSPASLGSPYIGDYIRLLAVGADFYGVFCGNNTPNMANFPNGVTYQRAADWTNHRLLSTNGVTVVQPSIDPFFFHWSETILPRGPILPAPRSPIVPRGP